MQSKLSPTLRSEMVEFLVNRDCESAHDWDSSDRHDIIRYGHKGVQQCTDLELLDEHIRIREECECIDTNADPQLRIMRCLLQHKSDPTEIAEVQRYINERIAELGGEPPPSPKPCKECVELDATIQWAKKELGL